MGLFHKLTFIDALEILDCDSLSEQQKKKVIKAESHFTEDEKTACNMLLCLHKDDGMALALLILDLINRENLPGEINAALYTHIAFRKFSEAHEKDPSKPDYIAYLALAYEHGSFCCEKDHSKAVETAEPLRSSDATGALVKQALKDIFPEGADSAVSDNKSADTPESEKANAAATVDTESTSPVVPSAATVRQKEEVSLYLYPDTNTVLGKVLFSNGDIYTGEFYMDNAGRPILHGYGKMCYANGETWDGEWDENLKASLGLHTFPDGKKQAEMTRMGLTYVKDMEIETVQKHLSEIAARTELRNQNAANYQTVTETPPAKVETKHIDFKNGSFYEGETRDGKMHGTGKYTWSDSDYYEGEFADGNFNGFGKRVYSSGSVYEGQWKDDKKNGHGTYTWADGDTFEGEWKDDKRCGRGKLIQYGKSPSGETYMKYSYDGEWLDSKENGHGICVEGDFGMEKMDKVLEGEWVNGKRQGRFVWYLTNSKGGRYMDFYEDGNLIETCIPYDERIKTVEDARRARALADGKSSSTTPVYTNSSPAAAQDGADTAEDFEWEEFSSVGELHEKILRPELFRDPDDRYLLNSCMYLDTFVDEFREEFTDGDYAETKEIIAEILGVESGELTERIERRLDFIRGFTEKEYLLAAMDCLAYDERTDLAPYLANLACYLWTDTGDGDYFDPLLDLFRMSGEYDDDDSTWLCAILRLQENGNIDEPLKPNDDGSFDDQFADFDDVFGNLLDQGYLPGSDGKMYLSDSDDNGGNETEESDTGDNVLLRYQNGDSYRGAAVGGVREGFGAYFFADGAFYRGCFHANKYEGYGMLDEGNGRIYKGLWKDDKRCGYGEQTLESGSKYFGWWKDNVYHGFGRFVFASGSENVGEFKNEKENGIFLIKRDGEWYGYKWVDGEIIPSLDGALITYSDGSGYVGQTVTENRRGLNVRIRQGYGEYRFPGNSRNGSTNIYQGQFSQDVPYGTGIRVDTAGEEPIILASDDFRGDSIPDGKCRAVRLTGVGRYKYALFYEGGYRDGRAFGSGMLYVVGDSENDHYRYRPYGLPIGSIVRCDHFDGGPTGAAIVTDEYGEARYGHFVDGFWEPNK